ncbi:ras-related protein Rab-23 [Tetranychus urticae]|uniref:Ras-related protein Rab-23 n=1 Tax=Tetranychus urticae TaxID=32264 RepID=T1KMM2_TETUR|nr:ras-related protein Rab-23 [Tetranychus urticae]
MRDDDFESTIKVVLVGNGIVGKSSLIQRYCNGIFTNEYKKTLGVDFLERTVKAHGQEIRLMLWDTAGQEEFDALTKAYYRGAQACVIVFSTTDRESFDSVVSWKKKVEYECGQIPMALVQNKMDLISRSKVSRDEVDSLARSIRLKVFRTSVKENLNVDSVFSYLAESYVDSVTENQEERSVTKLTNPTQKSDLISTPIFKLRSNGGSKYRRKRMNGPHGITSNCNAPVIHHFRYKNRFHLIPPLRPANSTILLHHRRYYPQMHSRQSDKLLKNTVFKSCWLF